MTLFTCQGSISRVPNAWVSRLHWTTGRACFTRAPNLAQSDDNQAPAHPWTRHTDSTSRGRPYLILAWQVVRQIASVSPARHDRKPHSDLNATAGQHPDTRAPTMQHPGHDGWDVMQSQEVWALREYTTPWTWQFSSPQRGLERPGEETPLCN
jgi:hypothetical protein